MEKNHVVYPMIPFYDQQLASGIEKYSRTLLPFSCEIRIKEYLIFLNSRTGTNAN